MIVYGDVERVTFLLIKDSKAVNGNPNTFLFPDTYTTSKSPDQKLTLLDVTSGKIEHLNLKQVVS